MSTRSTSVTELREAARPIFSKPGFKNLVWAGVHGALAYGEEDTCDVDGPSDVNMVAVWNPKAGKGWDPLEKQSHASIVDKLQRAWNRDFDVVDIEGGKLGDDYQASAMLCSRTLYGSAKNELVLRLREEARTMVDQGRELFSGAITKIDSAQKLGAKTSLEDFYSKGNVRKDFQDRVNAVLDDLDLDKKNTLLQGAYAYSIVEPSSQLREDLKTKLAMPNSTADPQSPYWKAIWTAVTRLDLDDRVVSLADLSWRIHTYALCNLNEVIEVSNELLRLEEKDSF